MAIYPVNDEERVARIGELLDTDLDTVITLTNVDGEGTSYCMYTHINISGSTVPGIDCMYEHLSVAFGIGVVTGKGHLTHMSLPPTQTRPLRSIHSRVPLRIVLPSLTMWTSPLVLVPTYSGNWPTLHLTPPTRTFCYASPLPQTKER